MHPTSKPSFDRGGFEVGTEHLPLLRGGPPAPRGIGRAQSTATLSLPTPQSSSRRESPSLRGGTLPSSHPRCEGIQSRLPSDALQSRRSPGTMGVPSASGRMDVLPPPNPMPAPPIPSAAVTCAGWGGGRAGRAALQLGSTPRGSAHPPPLGRARPGSLAPLPAARRLPPRSSPAHPHTPGLAATAGLRSPPRRRPPPAAAAAEPRRRAPRPPPPPPRSRPRDCFKGRAPAQRERCLTSPPRCTALPVALHHSRGGWVCREAESRQLDPGMALVPLQSPF